MNSEKLNSFYLFLLIKYFNILLFVMLLFTFRKCQNFDWCLDYGYKIDQFLNTLFSFDVHLYFYTAANIFCIHTTILKHEIHNSFFICLPYLRTRNIILELKKFFFSFITFIYSVRERVRERLNVSDNSTMKQNLIIKAVMK